MTSRLSLATLVAAACLQTAALPALAQDQAMTGAQIQSAWVGKKVVGRSTAGPLEFTMKPDGSAQVTVGTMVDSGTWRVTDTGYCAKWQKIRSGQERCFTVVNRGGKLLVVNPDGSTNTEVEKVVD